MTRHVSLLTLLAIAISVAFCSVIAPQQANAMPIHQSPSIMALKDAGLSVVSVQKNYTWRWRYSRSDATPGMQPLEQQRPLIQSNPERPITKPMVIREKAIASVLEDAFLAHQVTLLMTKSPTVAKAKLVQALKSNGIEASQATNLLHTIQSGHIDTPNQVVLEGLQSLASAHK